MNMSSLKKIKSIDQRTKDLAFGYIRESTQPITYTTIPMMINNICLLYYHLGIDRFVLSHPEVNISSNNVAAVNPSYRSSGLGIVHGDIIINPRKNPNLIAIWTIKINSARCVIGIHSMDGGDSIDYPYYQYQYANYAWKDDGGVMVPRIGWSYRDYDCFGKDDVIKMEFIVPQKKLKFYKNDEETDFEIDNIDLSENYHLMVAFGLKDPENSVEIMDFGVINYKSLSFLCDTFSDKFVDFSSGNDNMVIMREESDTMSYAHGNVMINPAKNPKMIAIWTLKIYAREFSVGIHSDYDQQLPAKEKLSTTYSEINKPQDSMHSFFGSPSTKNTIKMEMNVSKKQLRCYKDDRITIITLNDIDMSLDYHLTLGIKHKNWSQESGAKLIDFTVQNCEAISFNSFS